MAYVVMPYVAMAYVVMAWRVIGYRLSSAVRSLMSVPSVSCCSDAWTLSPRAPHGETETTSSSHVESLSRQSRHTRFDSWDAEAIDRHSGATSAAWSEHSALRSAATYVVMAYVVMAYVVTAFVVMTYVIMAYMVMAYVGMAYVVMAYVVI